MEFSKHFKFGWWGILIISVGFYLFQRLDKLILGESTTADIVVFLVWIALCLAPLFKEIELPGIKLKQEINQLRSNVEKELCSIRNEIRFSSEIRSNVSPNIWVGTPPPDENLPDLETNIKKVIEETFQNHGFSPDTSKPTELSVDPNVLFLFQARHNIEKELRHLNAPYEHGVLRRFIPIHKILKSMTDNDIMSNDLASAIREIYSVCSPAIHGEAVSEAKISFVKDTAPEVIGTLRAISNKFA